MDMTMEKIQNEKLEEVSGGGLNGKSGKTDPPKFHNGDEVRILYLDTRYYGKYGTLISNAHESRTDYFYYVWVHGTRETRVFNESDLELGKE